MTAGRDSRGLKSALRKHYALVNWSINLLTFYSFAVSLLIRQTREELARQPDLHHRVVFLQPPPSFDGGLDSQSLYLVIWFFNCPTKAIMLFSYNGESSCALFSQTYKTPFHFQAGLTPQDATRINFCPCRNSWMKSFFGRLLLLYLTCWLDSPVSVHTELLSIWFLLGFVGCHRSEAVRAVPSVANTVALTLYAPTKL